VSSLLSVLSNRTKLHNYQFALIFELAVNFFQGFEGRLAWIQIKYGLLIIRMVQMAITDTTLTYKGTVHPEILKLGEKNFDKIM